MSELVQVRDVIAYVGAPGSEGVIDAYDAHRAAQAKKATAWIPHLLQSHTTSDTGQIVVWSRSAEEYADITSVPIKEATCVAATLAVERYLGVFDPDLEYVGPMYASPIQPFDRSR